MSLRTFARPPAGFSASGAQYALSISPTSKACWVPKKCRAEYFSAAIFFWLRDGEEALAILEPRSSRIQSLKWPKKRPAAMTYDLPSRLVRIPHRPSYCYASSG